MQDDESFQDDSESSDDLSGGRRAARPGEGSVPGRMLRLAVESIRNAAEDLRPRIREFLSSSEGFTRGLKVIVIGTLSLAFLIVVLLLVFYRPAGRAAAPGTGRASIAADMSSAAKSAGGSPGGTVLSWITTPIQPTDYLVPRTDREALNSGLSWRLSRTPKESWGQKEISRFWIDPTQLVIEHLSKRNDGLIDGLLKDAP